MLFDAPSWYIPTAVALNYITRACDERPVTYRTTFLYHLRFIYNLQVIFPIKDILLLDNNIKGAFCLVKYHLDVVVAFFFMFGPHLFVPVGNTFGSLDV